MAMKSYYTTPWDTILQHVCTAIDNAQRRPGQITLSQPNRCEAVPIS